MLKRLFMSRVNQPSLGLHRLIRYTKGREDKIAVVVATVTNDVRSMEIPKLKVCALRFTEAARARIIAAGGECLTFDQLALLEPEGTNAVLLRGRKSARKATRFFGPSPGAKGSHTKPKVRSKGRKFERSRLRK